MIRTPRRGPLVVALAVLLCPAVADAQVRRGRASAEEALWAPIAVGAHVGYDDVSRNELAGVHAHVPVVRSGRIALIPSFEATFLTQAKDYQYSAELVYMTGGRSGGAFIGGGIGRRDSVVDASPAEPRKTFTTYSIVGGLTAPAGIVRTTIQIRWIFLRDVISDYSPRPLTIGVTVPLWGRDSGR